MTLFVATAISAVTGFVQNIYYWKK